MIVAVLLVSSLLRMMRNFFELDLPNLVHAPFMATAIEVGAEPRAHDFWQLLGGCRTRAQGQNICIVVFARQPRDFFIPGYGGAHARDFVGGDCHPGA
jgi:hypothetical protein